MVDMLYVLLGLAVPFMFGVAFGRGIRSPAKTVEHRIGEGFAEMAVSVRDCAQFVGGGVFVEKSATIHFPGKPSVEPVIRSKEPTHD